MALNFLNQNKVTINDDIKSEPICFSAEGESIQIIHKKRKKNLTEFWKNNSIFSFF